MSSEPRDFSAAIRCILGAGPMTYGQFTDRLYGPVPDDASPRLRETRRTNAIKALSRFRVALPPTERIVSWRYGLQVMIELQPAPAEVQRCQA